MNKSRRTQVNWFDCFIRERAKIAQRTFRHCVTKILYGNCLYGNFIIYIYIYIRKKSSTTRQTICVVGAATHALEHILKDDNTHAQIYSQHIIDAEPLIRVNILRYLFTQVSRSRLMVRFRAIASLNRHGRRIVKRVRLLRDDCPRLSPSRRSRPWLRQPRWWLVKRIA